MAKSLADEYHGHQCHSTKRLAEMRTFRRNNSTPRITARTFTIPPISQPPFLSEIAEDEAADYLYLSGEMTREEWQLAKERNRQNGR